jgi:hypothetical protein
VAQPHARRRVRDPASPAFTPNPDFEELDVGGVRDGTNLTVMLDDQPLWLLSVHLKSFCHQDGLDNVPPTWNSDCARPKRQIPILEGWIEARAQEGVPLVVLGDFDRRMNIDGDDMWATSTTVTRTVPSTPMG